MKYLQKYFKLSAILLCSLSALLLNTEMAFALGGNTNSINTNSPLNFYNQANNKQSHFYVGLDAILSWHTQESLGNEGITNRTAKIAFLKAQLGYQINDKFGLELGYMGIVYGYQYDINIESWNTVTVALPAFSANMFFLRLKNRFNLFDNKVFLGTTIGYGLGKMKNINSTTNYDMTSSSNAVYGNLEVESRVEGKNTLGLIETGINLETKLKKRWSLQIGYNYYTGLRVVNRAFHDFQLFVENEAGEVNDINLGSNDLVSLNGSFRALEFGVKYRLSK